MTDFFSDLWDDISEWLIDFCVQVGLYTLLRYIWAYHWVTLSDIRIEKCVILVGRPIHTTFAILAPLKIFSFQCCQIRLRFDFWLNWVLKHFSNTLYTLATSNTKCSAISILAYRVSKIKISQFKLLLLRNYALEALSW